MAPPKKRGSERGEKKPDERASFQKWGSSSADYNPAQNQQITQIEQRLTAFEEFLISPLSVPQNPVSLERDDRICSANYEQSSSSSHGTSAPEFVGWSSSGESNVTLVDSLNRSETNALKVELRLKLSPQKVRKSLPAVFKTTLNCLRFENKFADLNRFVTNL